MPRRESNSDNNTRARRRPSCAETSRCTVPADTATPAHMPTEPTNSRRRPIFQATSWLNYVYNSTKLVRVLTDQDANIFTQSTISRPNWLTLKHWRKVPGLPNSETSKSVERQVLELIASGPTWRHQMDAVLQRSQDSQSLSKSTTRKTTTLRSMTRTTWRGQTPPAPSTTVRQATSNSLTSHNSSKWTILAIKTMVSIWEINANNTCRITMCTNRPNIKTITNKCIIIIINHNIHIKTADSRLTTSLTLQCHRTTRWTKTSNRFGHLEYL